MAQMITKIPDLTTFNLKNVQIHNHTTFTSNKFLNFVKKYSIFVIFSTENLVFFVDMLLRLFISSHCYSVFI